MKRGALAAAGGGGGGGYGGSGGASGVAGDSSFATMTATQLTSGTNRAAGGAVTISYDPAIDRCP